jgi:hypothetical protein
MAWMLVPSELDSEAPLLLNFEFMASAKASVGTLAQYDTST